MFAGDTVLPRKCQAALWQHSAHAGEQACSYSDGRCADQRRAWYVCLDEHLKSLMCSSDVLQRLHLVSAEASSAPEGAGEHDDAEWEAFRAHQRDAARLPHAEEARVLFATAGCAALTCLLCCPKTVEQHDCLVTALYRHFS